MQTETRPIQMRLPHFGVAVENDLIELGIDTVDEALGEMAHPCFVANHLFARNAAGFTETLLHRTAIQSVSVQTERAACPRFSLPPAMLGFAYNEQHRNDDDDDGGGGGGDGGATNGDYRRTTTSGAGSVPLRSPRSWPPPDIWASMRTRGRRRTYKAPMPLGPYTLCEDIDMASMFMSFTSMGSCLAT